jgi:hypothetical protein
MAELENRVVISMRVRPETKRKLEQLQQNNPDVHWDLLLEPLLKGIHVPRNRSEAILEAT